MDPVIRLNAALEGRYRIERELGEGGMATVYLADDLRHERKVALKVLKPELAAVVGAERFLAEIKTTANLQHPHILPLFDSGEADSFLFYVMPYVEGESLRERLDREKQLPVDDAVSITTAVVNALQHAHDRKVIHRDIKPANILLQDGQPVVSDFGIALAVGAAGGSRLTETGLSVGTPYYMSPEQATGDQAVGPASDTYALACVLFEMLTGDPPYLGSTAQAVLGQIISGEAVSATKKRRSIPANVDAAIRKALEKLPADRFTGAQDFATALANPTFRHGDEALRGAAAGSGRWKAAALGLAALLALNIGWTLLAPESPPPVTRHILSSAGWAGLEVPVGRLAALAPDASSMILPVRVGDQLALAIKMRGSDEITRLSGTEGAMDVVYSPDGEWIAYAGGGELRKRALVGGSSVTLADDVETGNRVSLDWLDDGTILYEQVLSNPNRRQLLRIPESGGDPIQVVWPEFVAAPIWIRGLPGSRGALVIDCDGLGVACDGSRSRLHLVDLGDGSSEMVLEQAIAAWYAATGHLVYVRADGAVFAQPFDLSSLELSGSPVPLFEGVRGGANFADMRLAPDGTLLYVEGPAALGQVGRTIVWVDRSGAELEVDPGWAPAQFLTLALSPDDSRLAVTIATDQDPGDVWVKALPDGPLTRLTTDPELARYPGWSLDGTTIAYSSDDQEGTVQLRTVRSDGSAVGQSELLLEREGGIYEVAFAPDGQQVVFRYGTGDAADLGLLPIAGGDARPLLASEFVERSIALSPDGRWLAYVSTVTGQMEVFVRPFPDVGSGSVQVSVEGGQEPVWAHNGRELFYRELPPGSLVVATYEAASEFTVTSREPLFDASPYAAQGNWRGYDVSRDDQRFVMMRTGLGGGGIAEGRLILVENWLQELRERLGEN